MLARRFRAIEASLSEEEGWTVARGCCWTQRVNTLTNSRETRTKAPTGFEGCPAEEAGADDNTPEHRGSHFSWVSRAHGRRLGRAATGGQYRKRKRQRRSQEEEEEEEEGRRKKKEEGRRRKKKKKVTGSTAFSVRGRLDTKEKGEPLPKGEICIGRCSGSSEHCKVGATLGELRKTHLAKKIR